MKWTHSERSRFKVMVDGVYFGVCDSEGVLHLRPEFDNDDSAEALRALGFECEGSEDAGEDRTEEA